MQTKRNLIRQCKRIMKKNEDDEMKRTLFLIEQRRGVPHPQHRHIMIEYIETDKRNENNNKRSKNGI